MKYTPNPDATRALAQIQPRDPEARLHVLVLRWALGDYCTRPGCEGEHRALGLCDKHYRQHQRAMSNEAATI
jgi:hypothetical protein